MPIKSEEKAKRSVLVVQFGHFTRFAEDLVAIGGPGAFAAKKLGMNQQFGQPVRVLPDIFFRPVAEGFRHEIAPDLEESRLPWQPESDMIFEERLIHHEN